MSRRALTIILVFVAGLGSGYFARSAAHMLQRRTVVVQRLPNGERTIVQKGGYYARYLTSGHIVYLNKGTLFARTFDLARLAVSGSPVPGVEGVSSVLDSGGAQFAVSGTGTLAYIAGPSFGGGLRIDWLDHDGRTTPMRTTLANWFNIRMAPDGQRLALAIIDQQQDIWIYEWGRDLADRLTSDPGADLNPVWHTDGQRIAFASTRSDKSTLNLYWQRADRTGDVQRLTESKNPQLPGSWHRNGKLLAFSEINPTTKRDIMLLRMEGSEVSGWIPGQATPLLNTAAEERDPHGKGLLFASDDRRLYAVDVSKTAPSCDFSLDERVTAAATASSAGRQWTRAVHRLVRARGTADRRRPARTRPAGRRGSTKGGTVHAAR